MSRIRKANELAIEKTLKYLEDLKYSCDNGLNIYLSSHAELFNISKSTGHACKKLGIIKSLGYSKYEWLTTEPDRQMALLILETLRQRQQKTVDGIKLPGLDTQIASMLTVLNDIRDNTKMQNDPATVLKTHHRTVKENLTVQTLFSESDQRQRDRIYIAGQIAGARYVSEQFTAIDACNNYVIQATDDLLNKLYSK